MLKTSVKGMEAYERMMLSEVISHEQFKEQSDTYSGAQKFGNTQNFFEKLPPSGTETSKSNILWHTSSLVLDELACQFLSKYFTPLLSYANFPRKRVSKSLETP